MFLRHRQPIFVYFAEWNIIVFNSFERRLSSLWWEAELCNDQCEYQYRFILHKVHRNIKMQRLHVKLSQVNDRLSLPVSIYQHAKLKCWCFGYFTMHCSLLTNYTNQINNAPCAFGMHHCFCVPWIKFLMFRVNAMFKWKPLVSVRWMCLNWKMTTYEKKYTKRSICSRAKNMRILSNIV